MSDKEFRIAISGSINQLQEFQAIAPNLIFELISSLSSETQEAYKALIILDNNYFLPSAGITIPVFINEVEKTISDLNLAIPVVRVNLWPGFIENKSWEMTGELTAEHEAILQTLGKKFIMLKDEPGLLSARVIAMILNEAYFAIEDNVSTEAEIDTAMKLGTNYPYGPFEWAQKIGLKNIYNLLHRLSLSNEKYAPCSLLKSRVI